MISKTIKLLNLSPEEKEKAILNLKKICEACSVCELSKTRDHVVFGSGNLQANVVLIGEAPGAEEDALGLPFVGRAGKFLTQIMEKAGLNRKKDLYIINTVKCRPPENRNPLPEEKLACREYLDKQIEILKPKIIIICGNIALNSLLPEERGITRARGKWFDGPFGSKMIPIFHPSYLLRNDSREKGSPKWLTWQDIKEIRRVYDTL